jgi:hypothetical protein
MEQQTLIIHSTQAPVHGVAPTQVRLDMRRRLFRVGEFDESLPFLLRGRIDDGQFAATMHGLNCTLQAPSAMRTLMWLSVIGIWISFGIFLWDITSWNYAYDSFTTTWLFEGLMFFFAVMTIIFSIGYVLNVIPPSVAFALYFPPPPSHVVRSSSFSFLPVAFALASF